MSSASLKSYGGNLKKIAEANSRGDQMQVIINNRFKASLVDDPLRSNPELKRAIEQSRKSSRK